MLMCVSGLTTKAQRPGTRDATIATATPPPGSLQRMVRPLGFATCHKRASHLGKISQYVRGDYGASTNEESTTQTRSTSCSPSRAHLEETQVHPRLGACLTSESR